MYIKLTYREPEDRPILKAEFQSSHEAIGEIGTMSQTSRFAVYFKLKDGCGDYALANFNKQDFADFTDLVNRINKQINK